MLELSFSNWRGDGQRSVQLWVRSAGSVVLYVVCTYLFQDLQFNSILKGYCTVFQHALKLLEITGIVLTERMSKTAKKNSKGLKSYKEFRF